MVQPPIVGATVIASAKNSARANTTTVGVTVTHGFTLANGDVLFAFLGQGDDPGTGWTDSATAWTQIANQATSTGNDRASGVLRKVITNAAGEPSTYTFRRVANSATDNLVAIVVQVRGADTATPEDATATVAQGSNDFTPAAVAIDTATDDSLILTAHLAAGAAGDYSGANTRTAGAPSGSGYGIVNSQAFDDGSNTFALFLEVAQNGSVGAAGTKTPGTWTGSADDATSEYDVITVAVRSTSGAIVGSSAGTTTQTGTLLGAGALVGSSAGVSAPVATLSGIINTAGSAAGTAEASGSLIATLATYGTAAGMAAGEGVLTGAGAVGGSVAASASASGTLSANGALNGNSAGLASAVGTLGGIVALSGSAAGIATQAATLSGTYALAGSAAGTASVSATLTGSIVQIGAASGAATVAGTLSRRGRHYRVQAQAQARKQER